MFLANIFRKKERSNTLTKKALNKLFEKFLSDNNISQKNCKKHTLCKEAIYKLAAKINSFEMEYNYVPDKAYTLLSKLSAFERSLVAV